MVAVRMTMLLMMDTPENPACATEPDDAAEPSSCIVGEPSGPAQASEVPGFLFVDHFAVAVPRGMLEQQVQAYGLLGFREVHREDVLGTDQVREVLLEIGAGPNLVQLLEPLTDESPVQKLIERNGGKGGFAHVAFRVRDARAAYDRMKADGFQLIDAAPRPGSRGTTVFFVHPKSRGDAPFGYLIEIVEDPRDGGSTTTTTTAAVH
jgi:methylmalonyl-CoA/ethylmalonyl-CoA epimerase